MEDGPTLAIAQRARTRTTRKPGREVYSRRTKALIQVGATMTDAIVQPIGQTLDTGKKPLQRQRTDTDGHATVDVARSGRWMISTVWTRPLEKTDLADCNTIFAILTFGYPGEHPPR